jgi:SAM-dependent methyltransferase
MAKAGNEVWAAGDAYEPYVGRWSRLVARRFLEWLSVPRGAAWLDVGCGTGALTQTVIERAAPHRVVGIDPSKGFLGLARTRCAAGPAQFERGDAQALPFADDSFGAVVSGLVLNFVPDPAKALREMARVAAPSGCVAVYVWDYAGEMQLIRRFWDAAVALDAGARDLDEGRRFPMCAPDPLRQLFAAAGLHDIDGTAIDVPTHFKDFDDYWSPFLGGQGPAPGYCMALDAGRRERLRERLRATLPVEGDGGIRLIARAFATRGMVE